MRCPHCDRPVRVVDATTPTPPAETSWWAGNLNDPQSVMVHDLIVAAAEVAHCHPERILEHYGPARFHPYRFAVYHILYNHWGLSGPEVGRHLRYRDNATIIHGSRRAKQRHVDLILQHYEQVTV